jgi:hypothetical protein
VADAQKPPQAMPRPAQVSGYGVQASRPDAHDRQFRCGRTCCCGWWLTRTLETARPKLLLLLTMPGSLSILADAKGRNRMRKPQGATASIICAFLCLYTTFAHAGPCSEDIAQFEAAIRQSAGNPYAGLTAPQSVGAQLEHQPTPQSVKRAQLHLRATFSAAMARAKWLDSRGDGAGCSRALSAAKRMYIF